MGVLSHTAASSMLGEALVAGGLPGQRGERVPWRRGLRWGRGQRREQPGRGGVSGACAGT